MPQRRWIRLIALVLFAFSATASAAPPDFDREVAPIFARWCFDCHSGSEVKGGLDLASRAKFLAGGDEGKVFDAKHPEKSLLWTKVAGNEMPPKKPLSAADKAVLKAWLDAGAQWGADPVDPYRYTSSQRAGYDWWSLQPVKRPTPPANGNPIDAFLRERLKREKLDFAPPASRRTLARRLSFDLIGLPPSPAEIDAFDADRRPDAVERYVDRLLASPQYGVRWARHWLDVVRYGESNGFEYDEFRPNAWRYRDWVVDALNRDLPYNEFARLQIAGDVLHPSDPDAIAATGYLVAGPYDTPGQMQQSEAMRKVVRQDELEDLVGNVGQTFLGLTVNCARCHDHKFDPVRQKDYYRLAAALGGVRHGERTLPPPPAEAAERRKRIADARAQLTKLEGPARAKLAASGKPVSTAPSPTAAWDFSQSLRDSVSGIQVSLKGGAARDRAGIRLDGRSGYAVSNRLKSSLQSKTLEVWASLATLDQAGGAPISLQMQIGGVFDAVVFGEREHRQWMAGSEGFVRWQSFAAPKEDKVATPVHIAITYAMDGTIACYRNGKPFGRPYRTSAPVPYAAGEVEILIGLRHMPAGGNRHFAGTVHRARLYDRALSAAEVAESFEDAGGNSSAAINALLTMEQRRERARLQALIEKEETALASADRRAYAVAPRDPDVAFVLRRGDTRMPGEVATPGGVAAVADPSPEFAMTSSAADGVRRTALANWIASERNPLFARVMVNRLWHHHFGAGLVATPNDFGFNGTKPSYPELLDWLATEFVAKKWSLKALHRAIVLSAAYQQSGRIDVSAQKIDADDRLLWRMAPRRLEAEATRDAMLAVAGLLKTDVGGPSFSDFRMGAPGGDRTKIYTPVDADDPATFRRTLYRAWTRGGRQPLLEVFDCPDPSAAAPRRAVTTTPLQALTLLNGAFAMRTANAFAKRLEAERPGDLGRQLERMYELAYGRKPTAEERSQTAEVASRFGLAAAARAVFNSNEFLYVD